MRIAKALLFLILGIMIIPIFSIIALSFQNSNGNILKWYEVILQNDNFRQAFTLSLFISFCTSFLATLFSFITALSWYNKKQMYLVLVVILVIGLLPPDVMALSLCKVSQFLDLYTANLTFLIIGLTLYALPFGVLLFWTRFYFIENALLTSAKDIGIKTPYIIINIIVPLSKTTFISCLILSFLLAFNEYPRTFYLSGANILVSGFLNGKLSSGADESIYAGGSITIIMTALLIVILAVSYLFFTRNNAKSKLEIKHF